jgi:hypothetical protein
VGIYLNDIQMSIMEIYESFPHDLLGQIQQLPLYIELLESIRN